MMNISMHPRKLTFEPEHHLFEEEIIFQTFMFAFHVNFQGGNWNIKKLRKLVENELKSVSEISML